MVLYKITSKAYEHDSILDTSGKPERMQNSRCIYRYTYIHIHTKAIYEFCSCHLEYYFEKKQNLIQNEHVNVE